WYGRKILSLSGHPYCLRPILLLEQKGRRPKAGGVVRTSTLLSAKSSLKDRSFNTPSASTAYRSPHVNSTTASAASSLANPCGCRSGGRYRRSPGVSLSSLRISRAVDPACDRLGSGPTPASGWRQCISLPLWRKRYYQPHPPARTRSLPAMARPARHFGNSLRP